MRLAFVLAVVVVSSALASDARADRVAAERAWQAAEAERDPRKAAPLWEAAALEFGKVAGRDAAYAGILAWKNSFSMNVVTGADDPAADDKPTPLTAREVGFVQAVDRYVGMAPPDDDEVAQLLFLRARVFHRHGNLMEALTGFATLVTRHPQSEVAEYAANLLLDALNRAARYDELADWVQRMRANRGLLRGKPDLARTLLTLHVQMQRKHAEAEEKAGATDPSAYLRCARRYADTARANPTYERRDELLFNAGACYEQGGALDQARKAFAASAKLKTRLAPQARARAARLRP